MATFLAWIRERSASASWYAFAIFCFPLAGDIPRVFFRKVFERC
jgi:hypothetical protein